MGCGEEVWFGVIGEVGEVVFGDERGAERLTWGFVLGHACGWYFSFVVGGAGMGMR